MFLPVKFLLRRQAVPLLAFVPIMLTVGCASPGQPLAPSLHLPALAQKLTAERDGDLVRLAWTTPAMTTDKQLIKGSVTAIVCLDANPTGAAAETRKPKRGPRPVTTPDGTAAAAADCVAVKTLPVAPAAAIATDVRLAPELVSGPPRLVAYKILLDNDRARSAAPSPAVFVAAGAAPAAVGAVTVTAKREGALIQWAAQPGGVSMELKRTLVATAAGPVAAAIEKKAAPFSPAAPKAPAREVMLRADFKGRDAGGMLDTTASDGDTYVYVAQRVMSVTLGEHMLEMRGGASPATTFTYRDTFPPQAPTGLVLVPGGGFGEAPSIDLSWNANAEEDVMGYNVYRREGSGGFLKVTGDPVSAPAFRDMRVQAGRQYTYRVTAVDQRRNESAASGEANEQLR